MVLQQYIGDLSKPHLMIEPGFTYAECEQLALIVHLWATGSMYRITQWGSYQVTGWMACAPHVWLLFRWKFGLSVEHYPFCPVFALSLCHRTMAFFIYFLLRFLFLRLHKRIWVYQMTTGLENIGGTELGIESACWCDRLSPGGWTVTPF